MFRLPAKHAIFNTLKCLQSSLIRSCGTREAAFSEDGFPIKIQAAVVTRNYVFSNPKFQIFKSEKGKLFQFDDETSSLMPNIIVQLGKPFDWNNIPKKCSNADFLATFEHIRKHCIEKNVTLESKEFDAFVDRFAEQLPHFKLNEVWTAVQIFAKFSTDNDTYHKRNYAEIWIALDETSVIKANGLKLNQWIFLGSIWTAIPGGKRALFVKLTGRMMNKRFKSMSSVELVQAIFFMNQNKCPLDNVRNLENIFEANLDQMTLQDVSIVCHTFCRLEKGFMKPELRQKLYEYLLSRSDDELERCEDAFLISIFTTLHKSTQKGESDWLMNVIQKFGNTIEKRHISTALLILNSGMNMRVCDSESTEKVLRKCIETKNSFENMSLNDLVTLSRIIGEMNFQTESKIEESVGHQLLRELRNRIHLAASYNAYQKITKILKNLSMINMYDLELIENFLRPDVIKFIYKRNNILSEELFNLDSFARINLASIYTGPYLDEKYRSNMGKYLTSYIPEEKYSKQRKDNFFLEVEKAVLQHFGHIEYVNPTGSSKYSDIVVCVDKTTMESVDISHVAPEKYTGKVIPANIITRDQANLELYSFIMANTKFLWHNSDRYTGLLRIKAEQHRVLGYNPIVIPFPVWKTLNDDQRADYVKEKLTVQFNEKRNSELNK